MYETRIEGSGRLVPHGGRRRPPAGNATDLRQKAGKVRHSHAQDSIGLTATCKTTSKQRGTAQTSEIQRLVIERELLKET